MRAWPKVQEEEWSVADEKKGEVFVLCYVKERKKAAGKRCGHQVVGKAVKGEASKKVW